MISRTNRNNDLAAIHVLAAQLGMDTADKSPASEYRSMLFTVGGAAARDADGEISAANLDHVGRQRVREHLAQLQRAYGNASTPRKPDSVWDWVNKAAEDRRPMLWKIRAQLRAADRDKGYADGIAKAMFRIDRLELCGPRELHAIVTALNKDSKRQEARR